MIGSPSLMTKPIVCVCSHSEPLNGLAPRADPETPGIPAHSHPGGNPQSDQQGDIPVPPVSPLEGSRRLSLAATRARLRMHSDNTSDNNSALPPLVFRGRRPMSVRRLAESVQTQANNGFPQIADPGRMCFRKAGAEQLSFIDSLDAL